MSEIPEKSLTEIQREYSEQARRMMEAGPTTSIWSLAKIAWRAWRTGKIPKEFPL